MTNTVTIEQAAEVTKKPCAFTLNSEQQAHLETAKQVLLGMLPQRHISYPVFAKRIRGLVSEPVSEPADEQWDADNEQAEFDCEQAETNSETGLVIQSPTAGA